MGAGQGTITAANGSYSSSNAMGLDGLGWGTHPVGLSGTYTAQTSIQGTIQGSSIGLNGTSFNLIYDDDLSRIRPSLSAVTGTYSGSHISTVIPSTGEPLTMSIAADGSVSGHTTNTCFITGNVTPTTTGSTYRINLQYSGSCHVDLQSYSGVFLFASDSESSGIIGLTTTNARNVGVIIEAEKVW